MNDLDKVKDWVNNPNPDFSEGLTLFNRFKSNTKYDEYFNRAAKQPDNVALNMLKQKLIPIVAKLHVSPSFVERKLIDNASKETITAKQKTPPLKSNKVKKEFDPKDLPVHLAEKYDRIQQITPLLGGLHAKLKSCKNDEEAKNLSNQLVDLDKEKRSLWADIDEFNGLSLQERDKLLNPNPNNEQIIALGKTLKTTRDSLKRKLKDIEKHRENNKPELVAKGEEKAKHYQKNIERLENEIAKLSGDSPKA